MSENRSQATRLRREYISTGSDYSLKNFHFYPPPTRASKTIFEKMKNNTKVDEKLEGVDKFRAWKCRMLIILEENDLENYVEEEVSEL